MITLLMLERAKQGDAGAIAALMNDVLQAQEVWVKTTLESDCLQVMLKSPAVLNQLTCLAFIRRGLLRLQPVAIQQVRAYAWRTGDAFPLWIATFALEQNAVLPEKTMPLVEQSIQPVLNSGSVLNSSPNGSLGENAPASLQSIAPALPSSLPVAKQRSELFKLGFIVVLMTMVYFAVAGV